MHGLPPTHGMAKYSKQRKLDPETSVENLVASTISDFKLIFLKEYPKNKTQAKATQSRHDEVRNFCAMAWARTKQIKKLKWK